MAVNAFDGYVYAFVDRQWSLLLLQLHSTHCPSLFELSSSHCPSLY